MSNESNSAQPIELKSNGTAQLLNEKNEETTPPPEEHCETPKKIVAIETDDETIKKFTSGEPIIDQRNPFKTSNGDHYKTTIKKAANGKSSDLDKEKYKNAVNSLHKSTSDDFITTEDVLKQSKYVKTYIKNPDTYFVYDPAVLARIKKDDELQKLRGKKPIKKLAAQRKDETLKEREKKKATSTIAKDTTKSTRIPYKKCSKPNYPELSDIKVKVGTDPDGINYFNPIEVKTNVKKFDERIKNIQFSADDDLDDIEGPLTKSTSNSSEEINSSQNNETITHSNKPNIPAAESKENTFTSTITSKAFQKYLERNGLVLAPQKFLKFNENKNSNAMGKVANYKSSTIAGSSATSTPTTTNTNADLALSPKKLKKSSIFQRLLSNNIFSTTRRRTIPKEAVPTRRSVYTTDSADDTATVRTLPSRRIVLERKSKEPQFHSNHSKRASEANGGAADYGSSSSISSALSNAEKKGASRIPQPQRYANNSERLKIIEPHPPPYNRDIKQPAISQTTNENSLMNKNLLPMKNIQKISDNDKCLFERTAVVRRSLEPTRRTSTPQQQQQRQLLFGRSASMDRSEILKRTEQARQSRLQQAEAAAANGISNRSATLNNMHHDSSIGMPQLTSTPLKARAMQPQSNSALSLVSNVYDDNVNFNAKNEWMRLRAMKENSDRELYSKVFKQKSQNNENLYERLPLQQQQRLQIVNPLQASNITLYEDSNFVRNCQQRNTICGGAQREHIRYSNLKSNNIGEQQQQQQFLDLQLPRCQSVGNNYATKDNFDLSHKNQLERNQQPRTGNQTLSREEIIQKVKEFCRNSMRKKTQQHQEQQQPNKPNEIQPTGVKLSPVSYASVETQRFFPQPPLAPTTTNRKAAPQVPQRKQSLQKQPQPQQRNTPHHVVADTITTPPTRTIVPNLPIYANISKCNNSSIQKTNQNVNRNEIDDMPKMNLRGAAAALKENAIFREKPPYLQVRNNDEVDTNGSPTYQHHLSHAPLERGEAYEQKKWMPNLKCASESDYIMDNYNKNSIRQMPKLQNWPSKINAQQRQQQQPIYYSGQNYGRSTPLILERSNYYPSQIYHPQYRQMLPQYIARDRLLAQTSNPGLKQFSSNSLNIQHDVIPKESQQQQLKHEAFPLKQQKLQLFPYELNILQQCQRGQELLDEEDWQNENKSGRQQSNDQVNEERRRTSRREDPRRHTLGGDMLQYGVMQGQPQQRAMDLENQPIRSYAPINQGPLFDEDPGIMSEVETASTGFRRGGKQRSSLPVVRTPSKTLERPLGLVFLQYRSETKRALLPNEITSIDTVRALFVRSFPRQLTMAYLEGPNVKIYIHDASKDMFYELEDVRSHLREIRDRSVLRLFESNEVAAPPQVLPGGTGIPQPLPQQAVPMHWDQDQSYFSEPEFDSEYQHQHIHKSKPGKAPYYVGASQTLPRGMYSDRNKVAMGAPAKPLRSYGSRGNMGPIFPYTPDQLYSIPDGYTSSPERGTRGSYEEPYYSQYGTRGNVVAPIIDEENSEVAIPEDQYALYGMKVGIGRIPRTANQMYDPTRPEDLHRIRVEHMERQLANLTGLVQKALVNQNPQIAPTAVPTLNPNYLGVPTSCRGTLDETNAHSCGSHNSIQDKSVSFEKSVSFSDDIQGVPKSHSPQHAADTKPTKPAIKSSTLPRTSSQERDRLKPPPPPKPIALAQTHSNYRADIALAPEVYNHLRGLQKKAKDLRMEVRTLRRLSQAQAVAVREDIKDAFMRIRATLLASSGNYWDQQGDQEKTRISREEELYKQEVIRLEKDLSDLESSVEGLRGEVINRRTRVNMAAVEDMALVLSRASKTVAELKLRFPSLNNGIRNILSNEMEKVVREEKFLKEEPDRLESALRRCKKLTGTLVTLKRLASVQEQRLPPNEPPVNEDPPRSAEISAANKPVPSPRMGAIAISGGIPPENALDALLDELQTFARPLNQNNDFRPDDSTSDDSSQAILSTVTTQIAQACLYNPNDQNVTTQTQELPEITTVTAAAAAAASVGVGQHINHHHLNNSNSNANVNMLQVNSNVGSLRRLHSYPSGSDTDTSPPQPTRLLGKPPVPERNAELLSKVGASKRIPPPPPPRTSSRSPLASPTSPNVPHRMPSLSESNEPPTIIGNGGGSGSGAEGSGNSSGNESGNDQMQRQVALERRHQELLRKQKMLQEQYQRLQQMSKIPASALPPPNADIMQLKKTGSESNLPQKMGLCMSTAATGSMKNLNIDVNSAAGLVTEKNEKNLNNVNATNTNIQLVKQQLKEAAEGIQSGGSKQQHEVVTKEGGNHVHNNSGSTTIKQVYETEIL